VKRTHRYTEGKFSSLSIASQHKKCIELLNCIGTEAQDDALYKMYHTLCLWLHLPEINFLDIEQIEKRLHLHYNLAAIPIVESTFLPSVRTQDRSDALPFLNVHTFLDGLRSCHNVGSIIRTAEAFRLGPIHLSRDMMPIHHPQIQKTSMGAWKHISLDVTESYDTLPRPLIAVETVDAALSFHECIYPDVCTILLGNEVRGINRDLLKRADTIITIPLVGKKNSLNVANAFAIVAAQISCQLRRKTYHG
jgi:tRNA(Leu) C34 or U34 (ribose-2'-O)-methylase TrmL